MVSCDEQPPCEFYEEKAKLIVEVISESTEFKDRLEKIQHRKNLCG
jgi:hypothetical protein